LIDRQQRARFYPYKNHKLRFSATVVLKKKLKYQLDNKLGAEKKHEYSRHFQSKAAEENH
jgi:hypothetical protein